MSQQQPKILIIGPAWIGDMVMAHSLLRLLKQQHPNATIDVLAPAWTFSILKCMPEVSQAIEMPLKHGELNLRVRYQIAKKLQANKYDQAIVLQNSFKSALIPWLANIPVRTGWRGEFRYGLLNDIRKLDKKNYPLMVEQYVALGLPNRAKLPAQYPYPSFSVSPASQETTFHKLIKVKTPHVLALGAGAAFGPAKRWPVEYFAQVANQKLAEGWGVWLFGSKEDHELMNQLMTLTNHRCENVAGKTELFETIDLLSQVSGVVTNDSGMMHMAAALNKPVIAVYGSTSPDFTPPLSKEATILKLDLECQPCFARECPLGHFRCMRDLKPELVVAAMRQWRV